MQDCHGQVDAFAASCPRNCHAVAIAAHCGVAMTPHPLVKRV
jgi:hypothetical protein